MNLWRKNRIILGLSVLVISISCSSGSEQKFKDIYYENSNQQWVQTLSELGFEGDTLQNHVLLVVQTTACAPCLRELNWWNTEGQKRAPASLIILSRYKPAFDAFVETQSINLPVYQDSSTLLYEKELIPTAPFKLYFDGQGNISAMDYVGSGGDLEKFLKDAGI